MPDTFTANYNFTKPEVNASRDTWGNKHNANMDAIDTALKSLNDRKVERDPVNGKISQTVDFTGTATKGGATIATEPFVASQLLARLPAGVITLWWGTTTNIPAGWALCNGQNGTPDLTDRFIVGAGKGYGPHGTGGATTHTHGAGLTGSTALTVDQIPAHNHDVYDPGHYHAITDPQHNHGYSDLTASEYGGEIQGSGAVSAMGSISRTTNWAYTGISVNANYTGVSIYSRGGGGGHTHSIATADSRPPWYSLCYIMKL